MTSPPLIKLTKIHSVDESCVQVQPGCGVLGMYSFLYLALLTLSDLFHLQFNVSKGQSRIKLPLTSVNWAPLFLLWPV